MILSSTLLISTQAFAATTAFIAGACIVATVLFLIFTSKSDQDKTDAKHKVYSIRGKYFFVLVSLILVSLFVSLRFLPYQSFQGEPDQEVTVIAMQWGWKMGSGLTSESPEKFSGGSEITVPANKLIRFVVTSADVNHGFGIYNPDGLLIRQTQAMPRYSNNLEYVFREKGDYHILCMEYCGMPHGYMIGVIHVN